MRIHRDEKKQNGFGEHSGAVLHRTYQRESTDGVDMGCTAVYSEDYYDLIIEASELGAVTEQRCRLQQVSSLYYVAYMSRAKLPPMGVGNYSYTSIPNLFTTVDIEAMEASEIVQIQNQPALTLKGQGVLIGVIDTGIDYQNPVFRYADGTTRIAAIWDQTIQEGPEPEGFYYGAEYRAAQINEALSTDDPLQLVPSVDAIGHGTYVASLAAGGERRGEGFLGAAPLAQIAVVKLKEAKTYLREYYFTPKDAVAFQENDIMAGVAYLDKLAFDLGMPLSLCLGLGSSLGNHGGKSPIANVLDSFVSRRMRAASIAAGNEANKQHHFYGNAVEDGAYGNVEVNVGPHVPGFVMELWSGAQEVFTVELISPTGESSGKIPANVSQWEYHFIFENTKVAIDKNITFISNDYRLIFMRFVTPGQGIWTVRVYGENVFYGNFHMWLPMEELLDGKVYFLQSNPDSTITTPANARFPISVGGYNIVNNSMFLDSGRGYTISGAMKPDVVAPAVEVLGAGPQNRFVPHTGTCAAAAITAGAVALILEWAVVRGNHSKITAGDIKSMLMRGAKRDRDRLYPNREWGDDDIIVLSPILCK